MLTRVCIYSHELNPSHLINSQYRTKRKEDGYYFASFHFHSGFYNMPMAFCLFLCAVLYEFIKFTNHFSTLFIT